MKRVVSARDEWIYTEDGTAYLDALSGAYNVSYGHGHLRIRQRLKTLLSQETPLNCHDVSSIYRVQAEETLSQLTGYDTVHFFTTGAEAIEKALGIALHRAPDALVVTFRDPFHEGATGTLPFFRREGNTPFYWQRKEFNEATIEELAQDSRPLVVLVEPIQPYSGVIPPRELLVRLREVCEQKAATLIFDEVVTGLGRCGQNFLSDDPEIRPDILVLGESLGQGFPVSAVCYSKTKFPEPGICLATSTAGNPYACAIVKEVCEILEEEGMVFHSRRVGSMIRSKIRFQFNQRGLPFKVVGRGSMVFIHYQPDFVVEFPFLGRVVRRLREERRIIVRQRGSTLVMMPPFITSNSSIELIAYNVVDVTIEEILSGGLR